jgi:hypothetical protein
MATAVALTLGAALLFPLVAPATDCRFTLADQSDFAAKTGFYMELENASEGSSTFCKLKTMTLAVGVADGSQWRFIVAGHRWKVDRDYTAKAVIASAHVELYLDGRRLGRISSGFAGLPDRDLLANSVPSWGAGAGNYIPAQSSLDAVGAGTAVSETFATAMRPVPLMLLAPASDSRRVSFHYAAGTALTVTAVFRLSAASGDPSTYAPYIDVYGQSTHANFPGKIHADAELRSAAAEERKKLAGWGVPGGYDEWGGILNAGWQDRATRFFHVVPHHGVWWLISPAGNPCFYIGLDTGPLTVGNNTPTTGREWEFTALPPRTAPYNSAWSSGDWGNRGIASVSFDTWNMIRKYGSETWRASATKVTVERMKAWGFSGFGKWSGGAGSLPVLPVLEPRQVPLLARHADIFDPKVQALFRASLQQQMQDRVNDPLILGWSYGSEYNEIVTPDEISSILVMRGTVPAKRALVDQALSAIYGNNTAVMATAWRVAGVPAGNRSGLYDAFPAPPAADIEALREYFADRYYGFIYQTVKRIDPNHLYFGSWIVPGWWVNAADWKMMAAHADVIGYDRYAPDFENSLLRNLAKSSGKPIFLGEFSFPPSYNLSRGYQMYPTASATDDAAAGAKYRATLEGAIRNPWCVGVAWFEYRDQPVSGRGLPGGTDPKLVEGEDYAFGLVDVADRPKYDLVERVRATNLAMAQRRLQFTGYPPIAYIGRGGGTNREELISWPAHLPATLRRITAAISASGALPRNISFTSSSSIANRQ